jgi:ABC-type cobalamin/Fe3+-siderophores transport system ATPase subunit
MSFSLEIPSSNGKEQTIPLDIGEALFVLGANGTGKSSLLHRFYSKNRSKKALYLAAHRQTSFSSGAISLTPKGKKEQEAKISQNDTNDHARWRDDYRDSRVNFMLFNLVEAENVRARRIAIAAETATTAGDENFDAVKKLAKEYGPIKIINELLRSSNLPIELSVDEEKGVMASKSGSPPYSVAELSDGERNALFISANVLLAQEGALLIIDEPERHLHRSIISPLLTQLFAKRPDCAFIVSTHDVLLPLDNSDARTMLIRRCSYNGSKIISWDADLLSSAVKITDELKKDILGARETIIFIEGDENRSLDYPLYNLIFPNITVIAKSTCRDVKHAVAGIRSSVDIHWLRAYGIIDNDGRSSGDIDDLKKKGVYALPVFSVESLYYHPAIQKKIAERQVFVMGGDAKTLIQSAWEEALASIQPQNVQHLCERIAKKRVRVKMEKYWPKKEMEPINICIDPSEFLEEEKTVLEQYIADKNIEKIISRYPVRETSILEKIAKKLDFQGRKQYESAVRKLLMDDPESLEFIKTQFDTLVSDLGR